MITQTLRTKRIFACVQNGRSKITKGGSCIDGMILAVRTQMEVVSAQRNKHTKGGELRRIQWAHVNTLGISKHSKMCTAKKEGSIPKGREGWMYEVRIHEKNEH